MVVHTPTATATLPAELAYSVRWDSHSNLRSSVRGTRTTLQVSFTNTGNFDWYPTGPNQINLGYQWLSNQGVVVSEGFTPLPRHVLPGGSVKNLVMQTIVPSEPGVYFLRLDMVQQGVTWFQYRGSPVLVIQVIVR